jgi:D-alanyl-D-alanine endopeptidase (penicillin-binding protein 7)
MSSTLIVHVGWTLVHFVWQGALIACVAGLGLAALRNGRPQARYALACMALVACVAWPAIDFYARLAGAGAMDGDVSAGAFGHGVDAARTAGPLDWLQGHLGAIVMAWAVCTGVLALRMMAGLWWIERATRSHRTDSAWQARVTALAGQFGIARHVSLRLVDSIAGPLTAGWWRPVVLLPSSLLTGMPPELLEALLAHELGHIRRADYLVNVLQNVVEAVLFYHPAVWWLSRRIRIEREQIADDLAAHIVGGRRLALALSELEKRQFANEDLALAANGGDLMTRIRRLLQPTDRGLNWKALVPVAGLAAALVTGCAQLPASEPVHTKALVQFDSCQKPQYPAQAFREKDTGAVGMAFLVNVQGKVLDSRIDTSSGHVALDEAARQAIAKCTFTPATVNGTPQQSWAPVQYVWTLG